MKATAYLVYNRRGILRMTKTLPSLSIGERFTAITVTAPDSLWAEPKATPLAVDIPEAASLSPPVGIDLAKVPDVCFGPLVVASVGGRRSFICARCGYESYNKDDAPHWKPKLANPAEEAVA